VIDSFRPLIPQRQFNFYQKPLAGDSPKLTFAEQNLFSQEANSPKTKPNVK
jgi:hypothetical protein